MTLKIQYTQKQLERVIRMYRTTGMAAKALGITGSSLTRILRRAGLPTPNEYHAQQQAA